MSSSVFLITVNGESRELPVLGWGEPVMLDRLLHELALKADRVAVEVNGEIAPRTRWGVLPVHSGDRLEIVHFVGGGSPTAR